MFIIVFDTETTGLLNDGDVTIENCSTCPYILQFSYVVFDTESCRLVKVVNHFIHLPEGMMIPEDSIRIHGISQLDMLLKGVNILGVLHEFFEDIDKAGLVIGHNVSFDIKMVQCEVFRQMKQVIGDVDNTKMMQFLGYLKMLRTKSKFYCTMKESRKMCDIKAYRKTDGKEYVKFPKLSELNEKMFGYIPLALHDSLNDVLICLRCYCMMMNKVDICERNISIRDAIYKI